MKNILFWNLFWLVKLSDLKIFGSWTNWSFLPANIKILGNNGKPLWLVSQNHIIFYHLGLKFWLSIKLKLLDTLLESSSRWNVLYIYDIYIYRSEMGDLKVSPLVYNDFVSLFCVFFCQKITRLKQIMKIISSSKYPW